MAGINAWSVKGRLRDFFLANPEEELSFEDIAAKFTCSKKVARDSVAALAEISVLESVHVIRLQAKGIASGPQPGGVAVKTQEGLAPCA